MNEILSPAFVIRPGGLDDPQVVALLKTHFDLCRAQSPPESCHVLDLSGLRHPDLSFFSAWDGETLLGVGAVKVIAPGHGEVKSMHTAAAARGRGVGAAIVARLIEAARARGVARLSLETGVQPYFAAAAALYARMGFVECPPFGDYVEDPNSLFMTRAI